MPEPFQPDAGRPDTFVVLYTQHQRRLYRYLATLLARQEDVDDVLQEAARVMWQKFPEYQPDKPFLPWACGIARYEALNHLRRLATQRKHFSPAVVEQLSATREREEGLWQSHAEALRECLQKLNPQDRELIQQRYGSDDPLSDLAERTGRSRNALYKSLQRIRQNLHDCVSRRLEGEERA